VRVTYRAAGRLVSVRRPEEQEIADSQKRAGYLEYQFRIKELYDNLRQSSLGGSNAA
jgi:hypothetical protein